jgi:hypothetical protein
MEAYGVGEETPSEPESLGDEEEEEEEDKGKEEGEITLSWFMTIFESRGVDGCDKQ